MSLELTPQQRNELDFWKRLLKEKGADYLRFRLEEDHKKVMHFTAFMDGHGLDLGCGLVSVLAYQHNVDAVDTLMPEYYKLFPCYALAACHMYEDAEALTFAPASYDWVLCVNMIDHTPNPERVLSEIHRVLKPNGALLFEVNFDDALDQAGHYQLWNADIVERHFYGWQRLFSVIERVEEHRQYRYWAVYRPLRIQ